MSNQQPANAGDVALETLLEQLEEIRWNHRGKCSPQDATNCWVLDNQWPLNLILRNGGVQLIEEKPGELTLKACQTPPHQAAPFSLGLLFLLVKQHYCIKRFQFQYSADVWEYIKQGIEDETVDTWTIQRMLMAVRRRHDVVGFGFTQRKFADSSETDDRDYAYRDHNEHRLLDIVRNAPYLVDFELHGVHVGGSVAEKMGHCLAKKTTLKKLFLGRECALVSRSFLRHQCSMLHSSPFDIWNGSSLSVQGLNSETCRLLSQILSSSSTITVLDLSGGACRADKEYIDIIYDDGVMAVADALSSNTSVKTLSLKNAGFQRKGATAVAQMLKSNKTLCNLDISQNKIFIEGSIAIASAVECTTTLQSLGVELCNTSREGAERIVAALAKNKSNLIVNFGCCKETECSDMDMATIVSRYRTDRAIFTWTRKSLQTIGWSTVYCSRIREAHLTHDADSEDGFYALFEYLQRPEAKLRNVSLSCTSKDDVLCATITERLVSVSSIEELHIERQNLPRGMLESVLYALGSSISIWKLTLQTHRIVEDDNVCIRRLTSALTETLHRNNILEFLDLDIAFGAAFRGDIMKCVAESMEDNYTLLGFKCGAQTDFSEHASRIQHLCNRNEIFRQQAVHFALAESGPKRWAEAFSMLRCAGTLRRKLMHVTSMSHSDVQRLLRARWMNLCENYFRITGVVKSRLICYRTSVGSVQFEDLSASCIAQITSYLKVKDVRSTEMA